MTEEVIQQERKKVLTFQKGVRRGLVTQQKDGAADKSLLQVAKLPFLINDGKWHHLCITWTTRDGMWEAFQDGVMRGNGENLAPYHPIKPDGVLVLGQEQVDTHIQNTECRASLKYPAENLWKQSSTNYVSNFGQRLEGRCL